MTIYDHIPNLKHLPDGCRCIWTSTHTPAGWFRKSTHFDCPLHGHDSQQSWTVSDLPGGDHDGVSRSTKRSETL